MKIQRFHNCSPWVKSEGEKPRAKPQTNILPSCVHKNHKKYCSGGPKAIGTAKNTRNGLQDVQAEVLTLFDSGEGGADLPPPSRFRAYMWVYAYTGTHFFLLFLILSVEKDTTLLTLQKITVFPGTTKVGPICPTFIRGDPYEPHRRPEKVTFSDHQFGWF